MDAGFDVADEFGGEPAADDKPFDDEPFDAGVEADEIEEPKQYIQQLAGKIGQSLRKYEKEIGDPDFELEKFVVNSVLSATNTGEMDAEDQKDIITKVKTSGLGDGGGDDVDVNIDTDGGEDVDVNVDEPAPEGDLGAEEEIAVEEGLGESTTGMAENLKYDTKVIKSTKGNIGAEIWKDSGKITTNLYVHQHNPYGGSGWRTIKQGGNPVPLEGFTVDYIMNDVNGAFKNPENLKSQAEELVNKIQSEYSDYIGGSPKMEGGEEYDIRDFELPDADPEFVDKDKLLDEDDLNNSDELSNFVNTIQSMVSKGVSTGIGEVMGIHNNEEDMRDDLDLGLDDETVVEPQTKPKVAPPKRIKTSPFTPPSKKPKADPKPKFG